MVEIKNTCLMFCSFGGQDTGLQVLLPKCQIEMIDQIMSTRSGCDDTYIDKMNRDLKIYLSKYKQAENIMYQDSFGTSYYRYKAVGTYF